MNREQALFELKDGQDVGYHGYDDYLYVVELINKIYDEQENEETENLIYENRMMGLFLEILGLTPDDITDYVINGSLEDVYKMINKVRG